jgi:hypothetical protein
MLCNCGTALFRFATRTQYCWEVNFATNDFAFKLPPTMRDRLCGKSINYSFAICCDQQAERTLQCMLRELRHVHDTELQGSSI